MLPDEHIDLLPESEFEKVFALFARIDADKSGAVDSNELVTAIAASAALRKRLAAATGFWDKASTADIANAILQKADVNGDGMLQAHELEMVVRGWAASNYERMTPDEAKAAAERNRLAGARQRAERAKAEGGGFAGLTDSAEALAIGEAAQARQEAEQRVFGNEDAVAGLSDAAVDPAAFAQLTPEERRKAAEEKRLAGAKLRAERKQKEGGWFAGLTDSAEALAIGEAAQAVQPAERAAFTESEPTVFHDGLVYSTDAEAKAGREATEKEIRKQEHDEYLYKEQFKGLDAEAALRVGEEVKLGGEVVVDEEPAGRKKPKRMPTRLRVRMNKGTTSSDQKKEDKPITQQV